jgi:hypothetical protein
MPSAETFRRNPNPDANREVPFGRRDHFALVAGHVGFLVRSHEECHCRFAVSSRLGLLGG